MSSPIFFSKTVDIASLEARRPYSDLIATVTRFGAKNQKKTQEDFQRQALSPGHPKGRTVCALERYFAVMDQSGLD
ncbi:hypothetical protein ACFS4T_15965 [Pseudomonas lini]